MWSALWEGTASRPSTFLSRPQDASASAYFNQQAFGDLLTGLAPEVPEVVMHPKRPQAVFLCKFSVLSCMAKSRHGKRLRQMYMLKAGGD